MRTIHFSPLLIPILAVVGACAPAANLEVAPPILSVDWSEPGVTGSAATTSLAEMLASPELQMLTNVALQNNSDIKIAAARIGQSRALSRNARNAALPSVSASAGTSNDANFVRGTNSNSSEAYGQLDVAIELDIFGRLGARKRGALARQHVAELEREAIKLVVETEVATVYVQRAALTQRLAILERTIKRALDLEHIIRARFRAGDATRIDLGFQTVQVRNLQNERVRLREAYGQTRTALAVLTGAEAPQFWLGEGDLNALAVPKLAPDQPAEQLAMRPDVMVSEALIAAANGDVAIARTNFMPRITLSARGLASQALSGGPLRQSLSFGSSLLVPIFDRGRMKGDLEFARASQVEAVERYRRTILGALSEVENAQSSVALALERKALLNSVVGEARLTAKLLRLQYIEGEEGLQRVLDAEQSLGEAEDAQARAHADRLLAYISLYRATGGMAEAKPVYILR